MSVFLHNAGSDIRTNDGKDEPTDITHTDNTSIIFQHDEIDEYAAQADSSRIRNVQTEGIFCP